MLPAQYNGVQIHQTPGYVVIFIEMIHEHACHENNDALTNFIRARSSNERRNQNSNNLLIVTDVSQRRRAQPARS